MKQFKITFLIRSLNCGGAERQLVTLAREMHSKGFNVRVLVFYSDGPLKSVLQEAGVPVFLLNKKGRWDVIKFLSRLIKLIYVEKPDVLHGYLGIPNILTALLKPLFPHIRMVWGVRASNMDLNQYDWLSRLSYKIESKLSRFADLIIINSNEGLDYAVFNGFAQKRMIVIHNGIDTEIFFPDSKNGQRTRAEWGISLNEKLIGLVGRLDPMKDHPNFLKAAALLVQERDDVYFVCVGGGPADYRHKLKEFSHKLGIADRIIWAGARSDMTAVYNALDILTSSSYGEGFPNVIGEAMACGVPCVVTDVGDSAIIVGNTGIVVPPKSPEKLYHGWKLMLHHLDTRGSSIKNEACLRIISEFSLEKLVQRTTNALENLL